MTANVLLKPTQTEIENLAKEGYKQVCIWQGCCVAVKPEGPGIVENTKEAIEKFENWAAETFQGTRVKYLEEVKTLPDETGSGGRNDLFFLVHEEDVPKFAIPRLQYGIRWYEDVVSYNDHAHLYSEEVLNRYKIRW